MVTTTFTLEMEPFTGIGPAWFGMTKDGFSRAFTHVYESFFKTNACKHRSDHNTYVGVIAHYDDAATIEYFQVFPRPKYTKTTVQFKGVDITRFSVGELHELMIRHSHDWQPNDYGFVYRDLGMGIFNHDLPDTDGRSPLVECIEMLRTAKAP